MLSQTTFCVVLMHALLSVSFGVVHLEYFETGANEITGTVAGSLNGDFIAVNQGTVPRFAPSIRHFGAGEESGQVDTYGSSTYSTTLPTGTAYVVANSGSGGIFEIRAEGTGIFVPAGYTSGDILAGTSTFATTFASGGVTAPAVTEVGLSQTGTFTDTVSVCFATLCPKRLNEIQIVSALSSIVELRDLTGAVEHCIVAFNAAGVSVGVQSTGVGPFDGSLLTFTVITSETPYGMALYKPASGGCAAVGTDYSTGSNVLNTMIGGVTVDYLDVIVNLNNAGGSTWAATPIAGNPGTTGVAMPTVANAPTLFFRRGTQLLQNAVWYSTSVAAGGVATQQDSSTRALSSFQPVVVAGTGSHTPPQANGDPHITGANGERYVLKGETGKVYNLISAPRFSINFDTYHEEGYGLFMKTLGVSIAGHYFELSRDQFPDIDSLNLQLNPLGASIQEVSHIGLDLIEPASWRRFGIQRFAKLTLCDGHAIVVEWVDNRVDVVELRLPRCHDEFDGAVGATFQCQYAKGKAKWQWSLKRERSFIVPSLKSTAGKYDAASGQCVNVDENNSEPLKSGRVAMAPASPIGVHRNPDRNSAQ